MKVLHVITSTDVGGAEQMMKRLILAKSSVSIEHVVVSFRPKGAIAHELEEVGITTYSLNLSSPILVFFKLYGLFRIIRDIRPEIVQTWMYHADLIGGIIARLAGVKRLLWGVRNTGFPQGASRVTWVVMYLSAFLSRWVPWKIVSCAHAATKSHIAFGYNSEKFVIVENGFEVDKIVSAKEKRQAMRDRFNFGLNDLVLGGVGRFDPVKDYRNWVLAAGMKAKLFPNLKFLLVGRNMDRNNSELVQWIEDTGYAERFVLAGETRDVPSHLAAMDLFCMASQLEAFPNVLGEAMCMGLPCITTNAGDAALILGGCGIQVPTRDLDALASGLEKLILMTDSERKVLGDRARQRIQDEYSLEASVVKYHYLYQNTLFEVK